MNFLSLAPHFLTDKAEVGMALEFGSFQSYALNSLQPLIKFVDAIEEREHLDPPVMPTALA
jgi:hypothetical protein